jgi:uncharacterized membrane protein
VNRVKVPVWPSVSYVAALVGTGVAAYLVSVHYDDSALICTVGDCATVQKSTYAELWGMPIALLGLGMYLAILGLGVLRWRRPAFSGPATLGAFSLALAGALYAAYLTYVELFVIDAICQWCVASAVLTLVVLAAESAGVWAWMAPEPGDDALPHEPTPANGRRRAVESHPAMGRRSSST